MTLNNLAGISISAQRTDFLLHTQLIVQLIKLTMGSANAPCMIQDSGMFCILYSIHLYASNDSDNSYD